MKATTTSNIESIMGYNVEEIKEWHPESVRQCCIDNKWYTCGTNEEYSRMLDYVRDSKPILSNLFTVAKDIFDHSDWDDQLGYEDEIIESIMFKLNEDTIFTSYWIS